MSDVVYRVVSNGTRYCVERLQWRGWLWGRELRWESVKRLRPPSFKEPYEPDYPSLDEANKAMDWFIAEESALRQVFQPMPDQENHART